MMATSKPGPSPIPPRNPIPLSAAQEGQVRDLYYKRVRGYCANQIRDFAACAANRTISATWACRQQRLAMNGCMLAYATQEEEDAAREAWFATMDQRRMERQAKEIAKQRAEAIYRESGQWLGSALVKSRDESQGDKTQR